MPKEENFISICGLHGVIYKVIFLEEQEQSRGKVPNIAQLRTGCAQCQCNDMLILGKRRDAG